MATRYVNKNQFPIFVPDERGGQVMFRPGEGTTKQWFSRLCGPRQLTRISDNALVPNSMRGGRPVIKEPSVVVQPVQSTVPPKPSFNNVSTDQYEVNNGIYKCKLCDLFRTGSSISIKAHIQEFHMKPAEVAKPEPKLGQDEGEGEKAVVSSKASVTQNVQEDKEEVRTSLPRELEVTQPQQPQPVVQPEPVFACTKPGCGKSFKSKRALSMHETRMHK